MTASDRADLLVVGASFAGVACAIEAARAGLRVILIDRKSDAGEKLHTTGIVVKEAADEIGVLEHEISGLNQENDRLWDKISELESKIEDLQDQLIENAA